MTMPGVKMIDPSFTVRSMLAMAATLAFFWAGGAIAQTDGQAPDVGTQAAGAAETMQVEGAPQIADASAKCDDLAADPEDPEKPAGIRGVETVSPDAVAACSQAVDADPQNARLNYQAGRAYAQAGEQTKAFFHFDRASSLGSIRATAAVANAYMVGAGVGKDEGKALEMYKRAASQGDSEAAIEVGKYYSDGPSRNLELAAQWLSTVDNAKGYVALGDLYRKGYENASIALKWYRKAAEAGDGEASYRVGEAYFTGKGAPRDLTEAISWFSLAAERGEIQAYSKTGWCYQAWAGDPDYEKAIEWYSKGVAAGDVVSMRYLGDMYRDGKGITTNGKEAVKLYQQAADLNDKDAMDALGYMYSTGYGVEKDLKLATEWYKKAAAAGSASAMNRIGILYRDGIGVEQDYVQAGRWFEKAAEAGYRWGDNNLAALFSRGQGVRKDVNLAVDLLESAVRASDVCDNFKKGWFDWSEEFIRALQSRLAAKYGYKGSADGRFRSGSLKAFDAMCKAKSG